MKLKEQVSFFWFRVYVYLFLLAGFGEFVSIRHPSTVFNQLIMPVTRDLSPQNLAKFNKDIKFLD